MPSAAFLRQLDLVRRRAAAVDAAIQRDVATVRVPGLPGIDPFLASILIGDILSRSDPKRVPQLRRLPLSGWVPLIKKQLDEYAEQSKTPPGEPTVPVTALPFPAPPSRPVEPPVSPSGVTPFAVLPNPDLPEPPTDAPANRPDGTTGAQQSLPPVVSQDMRALPPAVPARLPEPEQTPRGPKVLPPPPVPPPAPGGAIIPLPPPGLPEPLREAWIQARTRAGDYCRGLGDVIRAWPNDVEREAWSGENIAEEVNAELRRQKREIIRTATAEAVAKIWTPERLASELGHKTGEWSRNWLRVASTELQGANNEGILIESMRAHGDQARVARIPEAGACASCMRLFTDGGRPIVFNVSELLANGTNVGRKEKDWRPTIWPVHPQCLVPGVRIRTIGGETPIEDIRPGDRVLTHLGRWRPVVATTVNHHDGPLYTIETDMCAPLPATGNHPLMVENGWLEAKDAAAVMDDECLFSLYEEGRDTYPVRILSVTVEHYTGPVHNFEVADDESYVANNIIVHNCRCSTMTVPPGTTVTHDGTIVGVR